MLQAAHRVPSDLQGMVCMVVQWQPRKLLVDAQENRADQERLNKKWVIYLVGGLYKNLNFEMYRGVQVFRSFRAYPIMATIERTNYS